jgi:hypothetical protein
MLVGTQNCRHGSSKGHLVCTCTTGNLWTESKLVAAKQGVVYLLDRSLPARLASGSMEQRRCEAVTAGQVMSALFPAAWRRWHLRRRRVHLHGVVRGDMKLAVIFFPFARRGRGGKGYQHTGQEIDGVFLRACVIDTGALFSLQEMSRFLTKCWWNVRHKPCVLFYGLWRLYVHVTLFMTFICS